MKLIFQEERDFIRNKLAVTIPENCWRDGSKIYLNIDTRPAIIEFKVENGIMKLKKNNIREIHKNGDVTITIDKKKTKRFKNLTWQEEFELRKDYLMALEQESIEKTKQYILDHPNHELRVSISGGKDSDLTYFVVQKAFNELNITRDDYKIDVFNTTNDTAQTYLHIKRDLEIEIKDIHTPEKGWYQWLKEDKNWFIPSTMVRNCCSTYKEGQVNKILNKKKYYIMFLGMRKYESQKRAFYDWDLNEAYIKEGKKPNVPDNWKRFLPIVNFKDEDVWLMLLHYNIPFNEMYKLGFNRCGCLLCPYSSDYSDLLIREYYPLLMKRWEYALDKNYDLYDVENRLKWTKEEWRLNKWKQGTSKEYELIKLKPTKERVKQLAEIKGISEEMALKYFKRKCKCCDKNLNPDEIAMNLKLFGRYEGTEDNREFMCKKHLCEYFGWTGKQYQEKVWEFRNSGCDLF